MSSIEERLARDIAAVTGGVVVTESDMRNAREEIDERIDDRRQRGNRRAVAAVAAAAVMVPFLGVAAYQALDDEEASQPASPAPASPSVDTVTDGDPPTDDLIEGLWRVDNGVTLVRFSSPNSFAFDTGGRVFDDPSVQGTYELDGEQVTLRVDDGPVGCVGQTIAMTGVLPGVGSLRLVQDEPGAGGCSLEQSGQWVLEQVLPARNEDLAGLRVPVQKEWTLPIAQSSLPGTWMALGGGHVLELSPDRDYYVAAGSGDVVDRGTWTVNGSMSQLTLTSDAGSETCSEGDRLVLAELEFINSGALAMRGATEQDTCSADWAQAIWIQFPHFS